MTVGAIIVLGLGICATIIFGLYAVSHYEGNTNHSKANNHKLTT